MLASGRVPRKQLTGIAARKSCDSGQPVTIASLVQL
jgi:hypothetical protein